MKIHVRFLLLIAATCFVVVQDDDIDKIRPRAWSVAVEGLSTRLRIDDASVMPGSELRAELFFRADDEKKHAKLLQGRIIFTFVPITNEPGNMAVSSFEQFSGGGGLVYTGKTAAKYQLTAPLAEGKYYLFATVLSTADDVKSFLMAARVSANAGPWWIGTMTTPPIRVDVAR